MADPSPWLLFATSSASLAIGAIINAALSRVNDRRRIRGDARLKSLELSYSERRELYGRTVSFLDRVKCHADDFREAHASLTSAFDEAEEEPTKTAILQFDRINKAHARFEDICEQRPRMRKEFNEFRESLQLLSNSKIIRVFDKLEEDLNQIDPEVAARHARRHADILIKFLREDLKGMSVNLRLVGPDGASAGLATVVMALTKLDKAPPDVRDLVAARLRQADIQDGN